MATEDFYISKGDTRPKIVATLEPPAGQVPNWSGATVRFVMRRAGASAAKIDAVATNFDAATRRAEYAWVVADTDTPGLYYAKWTVVEAAGHRWTFPNRDPYIVKVGE